MFFSPARKVRYLNAQKELGAQKKNWWGTEWSTFVFYFLVVLQSLIIRDNRLQNDYTVLDSMIFVVKLKILVLRAAQKELGAQKKLVAHCVTLFLSLVWFSTVVIPKLSAKVN